MMTLATHLALRAFGYQCRRNGYAAHAAWLEVSR